MTRDAEEQETDVVTLNMRAVDTASFRTSKAGDDLNDQLRRNLGLQHRYEPARLAIARSIAIRTPPPQITHGDTELGKVINGRNLFGEDDLPVWVTLIIENSAGRVTDIESLAEEVRRHWHRGIHVLAEEWTNCDENYERFVLCLSEKTGIDRVDGPTTGVDSSEGIGADKEWSETGRTGPVRLKLGDPGTDLNTGEPVMWHLNGKGSPHVALMGATGTGKTRLARNLLEQSKNATDAPVLVFDFKGDLSDDRTFLKAIDARVIEVPSQSVPLDVLYTHSMGQGELSNAAMRFRESFTRIPNGTVGAVQQDLLRDAARSALRKRRPDRPISIRDVRDELSGLYNQASRKADIVTSTFNDLTQEGIELFSPTQSPVDFFSQSWVIDVHEAQETAQRLVVFLVLDALYGLFKTLRDSPMDLEGNRAIRHILVVDEARRVLGYGQPSLSSLVRESRSKGMSIYLISQSPDDYDTVDDNFLEQIGLTVCFRCNSQSPKVLRACLGQNVDLAGLQDGVAVTRLPGKPQPVRFQAWS